MSNTNIVTRFSPSPTGHLHIGSARTALYCWLYARATGGKFILRIEDTDVERSTQEYTDSILEAMQWMGLDYDELHYQSNRLDRYKQVIQQLLDSGDAYYCYCSKERLDKLREQCIEQKIKPRYDGYCREKNIAPKPSQDYVIRLKNPLSGSVKFIDNVCGEIEISNSELDDFIIQRSDGSPTYNFAVVIDDIDMQVSDVVRGADHISNTPRQINLYKILNAKVPTFTHMPLILAPDGKRLSKRYGAINVLEYRDSGILPEAFLNYLVRLGWSAKDQEIFSKAQMLQLFKLSDINKSAAQYNSDKLLWVNQHYIKNIDISSIISPLKRQFALASINTSQGPELEQIFELHRCRCKTLVEIVEQSKYFYQEVTKYNQEAMDLHLNNDSVELLEQVYLTLEAIDSWQVDSIKSSIKQLLKQLELKMPKLAQPLRICLTGDVISPSIDAVLALLGKQESLNRIKQTINLLNEQKTLDKNAQAD